MRRICIILASLLLASILFNFTSTESAPDKTELRFATSLESSILVRVRGQGICTGTPITGTLYVVTAAHCIVDKRTWEFTTRYDVRVEYNDKRYDVTSVLVDVEAYPQDGQLYSNRDVAVLILREQIPGVGAYLGEDSLIENGATLVGYQSTSSIESFYRPKDYASLKQGKNNVGVIPLASAPAACSIRREDIEIRKGFWSVPCGMIPGGSGGPMIVSTANDLYIVGVLSSVNASLSSNGIAPVSAVRALIANPAKYTHSYEYDSIPAASGTSKS